MHLHLCGLKGLAVGQTRLSSEETGGEPIEQYNVVFVGHDGTQFSVGEFTKTELMRGLNECLSGLMEA